MRRVNMKMSNKVYDVLKFIAQILLPALGTLYFALLRRLSAACGI